MPNPNDTTQNMLRKMKLNSELELSSRDSFPLSDSVINKNMHSEITKHARMASVAMMCGQPAIPSMVGMAGHSAIAVVGGQSAKLSEGKWGDMEIFQREPIDVFSIQHKTRCVFEREHINNRADEFYNKVMDNIKNGKLCYNRKLLNFLFGNKSNRRLTRARGVGKSVFMNNEEFKNLAIRTARGGKSASGTELLMQSLINKDIIVGGW